MLNSKLIARNFYTRLFRCFIFKIIKLWATATDYYWNHVCHVGFRFVFSTCVDTRRLWQTSETNILGRKQTFVRTSTQLICKCISSTCDFDKGELIFNLVLSKVFLFCYVLLITWFVIACTLLYPASIAFYFKYVDCANRNECSCQTSTSMTFIKSHSRYRESFAFLRAFDRKNFKHECNRLQQHQSNCRRYLYIQKAGRLQPGTIYIPTKPRSKFILTNSLFQGRHVFHLVSAVVCRLVSDNAQLHPLPHKHKLKSRLHQNRQAVHRRQRRYWGRTASWSNKNVKKKK